nr:hypothetical protein [Sphingomonas bacterium]
MAGTLRTPQAGRAGGQGDVPMIDQQSAADAVVGIYVSGIFIDRGA